MSLLKLEEEMVGKAEQIFLSSTSLTTMTACLLFLKGLLPLVLTPLEWLPC